VLLTMSPPESIGQNAIRWDAGQIRFWLPSHRRRDAAERIGSRAACAGAPGASWRLANGTVAVEE
jgi:hypothetical protein